MSDSSQDSPSGSSPVVARALYSPLETALIQEYAKENDVGLVLQCLELYPLESASSDVSLMSVQLHCRGLAKMQAQLFVTCLETNSYDVLCAVHEGRTHRFSYPLPADTDLTRQELVPLAQDVASFLCRELETRLGRLLLQSPARPPTEHGSLLL